MCSCIKGTSDDSKDFVINILLVVFLLFCFLSAWSTMLDVEINVAGLLLVWLTRSEGKMLISILKNDYVLLGFSYF